MTKLHLGCGGIRKNGYVNIDIRETSAVDLICDITKLPFKNNSIDEILAIHCLEHIDPDVLSHWSKLLKSGGKLIVEVPNLEKILELDSDFKEQVKRIFGLRRFKGDSHIFGYSPETLKEWLEKYNFKVIKMSKGVSKGHTPELSIKAICLKN